MSHRDLCPLYVSICSSLSIWGNQDGFPREQFVVLHHLQFGSTPSLNHQRISEEKSKELKYLEQKIDELGKQAICESNGMCGSGKRGYGKYYLRLRGEQSELMGRKAQRELDFNQRQ